MQEIRKHTYYRVPHITGPNAVLVSIRFGSPGDRGIAVLFRAGMGGLVVPEFDIEEYVQEVVEGVDEANEEAGENLEICEIEIVPDDYPKRGQAKVCARELARAAIEGREVSEE